MHFTTPLYLCLSLQMDYTHTTISPNMHTHAHVHTHTHKINLTPCDGYVSQPQSPDIEEVSSRFTAKQKEHL